MQTVTREEAIEFIRQRQEDVAAGNRLARFRGVTLCLFDDPEEKQIEDYIRSRTAFLEWEERVEQGRELLDKLLASLPEAQRRCVEEYISDVSKG